MFARAKGAPIACVPLEAAERHRDETTLVSVLEQRRDAGHRLFAYPGQSNCTGVQHPLAWINEAQERGWDVLLDAASFVPGNRLDLSRWHPDFVPVSFYKMCGYPTGVGCLLARNAALANLQRPWLAGRAINGVSALGDWPVLAKGGAPFED